MHTIQELDEGHWEQWQPLWNGYLQFYRAELPAQTTRTTFARLTGGESSMFGLLAESEQGDGIGLAHCVLHPSTWSEAPSCYLEDLFVAPTARGADVGRSLLEAAQRASVQRAAGRLYWHTQSYNAGRVPSTTWWPDRRRSWSTKCEGRPSVRRMAPLGAWKDAGVPNLRTMVTELGTGLGMLGSPDLDEALRTRSPVMRSLSPEDWDRLGSVRAGGAYDAEFHAAWLNGNFFLAAREGLRGRRPEVVEWKGAVRGSGDEVAPVDLRIDHVYLVSCKYTSKILFNASPTHVFDSLLVGGPSRRGRGLGGDWYAEVAPLQYQHLYDVVRAAVRDEAMGGSASDPLQPAAGPLGFSADALPGFGAHAPEGRTATVPRHSVAVLRELPARAADLTSAHRSALGERLRSGWPGHAEDAYRALSDEVSRVSVSRWRNALSQGASAGEAMLWRLLRMGSAPYFVLGSSVNRSLRLRIATPWDWKQRFGLARFEVFAQEGGQPRVGWLATVRERASGQLHEVAGHVEVRWSHGRFGGLPEAKGYLDTHHHLVPGYFPLL